MSTTGTLPAAPVDAGVLDVRVGVIREARRHPDADALYVEQIDVGEAAPREIVSGLVKWFPNAADIVGRRVCVMCNLKPAPLRGIVSHGMVMCASAPEGQPPRLEFVAPPDAAG